MDLEADANKWPEERRVSTDASAAEETASPSRELVVLSCVSGGPMDRLVTVLTEGGTRARVAASYTPERWRKLMASGSLGRLRARFGSFVFFPFRALWTAIFRRGATLVPTTNPFMLPTILVATRWLHRKPVVPLIYDLFPDVLEASNTTKKDGLVSKLLKRLNRFMLRRADGVVFIGEHMARHATQRYGEPKRWTIIETGACSDEFSEARLGSEDPQTELERWCSGKTVFSYVGNMGHVHDWETMTLAFERLADEARDMQCGVVIAASGPGRERMQERLGHISDEVLRFESPLPDRDCARLLRASDVALVTLKDEAKHTSVPSKMFSAIAARNAILAIAPLQSDLGQLVEKDELGVVTAPGDTEGLVDAMREYLKEPAQLRLSQERAYKALRQKYDLPRLAERWLRFCKGCVVSR